MIVARIVSGYGMGFINSTAPVLQSEFSPKAARGRYVCAQLSTLNFGTSISLPHCSLDLSDFHRYRDSVLD